VTPQRIDAGNADDNDKGQHHGVFNCRRPFVAPQEMNQTSSQSREHGLPLHTSPRRVAGTQACLSCLQASEHRRGAGGEEEPLITERFGGVHKDGTSTNLWTLKSVCHSWRLVNPLVRDSMACRGEWATRVRLIIVVAKLCRGMKVPEFALRRSLFAAPPQVVSLPDWAPYPFTCTSVSIPCRDRFPEPGPFVVQVLQMVIHVLDVILHHASHGHGAAAVVHAAALERLIG
jgi:hypothetical protein